MTRACLAPRCVPIDLLAVREQVAAIVCSSAWLDVCWDAVCCGGDAAGHRPEAFLLRHGIYPPGGAKNHRGMRRCADCGRWCPRPYVSDGAGVCLDCREERAIAGLPETDERTHVTATHSLTTMAVQRMEVGRVRLVEARIMAEDEGALLREIATYRRTGMLPFAPEFYKNPHL